MDGPRRSGPSESARGSGPRSAEAPPRLRLGRMPAGQVRALDLPLIQANGRQRSPTPFYLGLKISCEVPGRLYSLDVKPDFGRHFPTTATLTVVRSRFEATRPVQLIEGGEPVERTVLLELEDGTDQVVFWLCTTGAAAVPQRMAATIDVTPLPRPDEGDPLDTMRLPTVRQAAKEELAHALRRTPYPALATLGELMVSDDGSRKIAYLKRLIATDADVCLVEAAVRDLDLCEQTVPGFAPTDFAGLCLSDLVDASIAVFHPAASPFLVHRCLTIALDRRHDDLPPGQLRLWRALIDAAVVGLQHRAPELLQELTEDLALADDGDAVATIRKLTARAVTRLSSMPPRSTSPIEECLLQLSGEDPHGARSAAVELLTRYGFVWIAAPPD